MKEGKMKSNQKDTSKLPRPPAPPPMPRIKKFFDLFNSGWEPWEVVEENVKCIEKRYHKASGLTVGQPEEVYADRLKRVNKKTGMIEYKLVKRS